MLFPTPLIALAINPLLTTALVLPLQATKAMTVISIPTTVTTPPTIPTLEARIPKTTYAFLSDPLKSIHLTAGTVTHGLPSIIEPYFWTIPKDSAVRWTSYVPPTTTLLISSLMWPSHTPSPSPTLHPRDDHHPAPRVTATGPQFTDIFTAEIINPSFTIDIVNVPGVSSGAAPTVTNGGLPSGKVYVIPEPSADPILAVLVSIAPFIRPISASSAETSSYLMTRVNVPATRTETFTETLMPYIPATPVASSLNPSNPPIPLPPLPPTPIALPPSIPSPSSSSSHLSPAAIACIALGVLAAVVLAIAGGVWGLLRFRKARRARDEEVARRGEWYGRDVEMEIRRREMDASFKKDGEEGGRERKEWWKKEGKEGRNEGEGEMRKESEMVDVDLSDGDKKDSQKTLVGSGSREDSAGWGRYA